MLKEYSNKVINNILGKWAGKRKVEIEKEKGKLEVEWEEDD